MVQRIASGCCCLMVAIPVDVNDDDDVGIGEIGHRRSGWLLADLLDDESFRIGMMDLFETLTIVDIGRLSSRI